VKVVIVVRGLYGDDAVGIDVLQQYLALKEKGFDACMYADNFAPNLAHYNIVTRNQLNDIIADGNNLVLYHHCLFWPYGQEIIENSHARIFMRHHSVTPSAFFEPYCEINLGLARLGRLQSESLVRSGRITHYLATSPYTMRELVDYGAHAGTVSVAPPFHKIDSFGALPLQPDIPGGTDPDMVNVLFVGRVAPNKGHRYLIETMRTYRERFDGNIRLTIIGKLDPQLHSYYTELRALTALYDLSDTVFFTKQVTFEELHAYYASSTVFLCMSEHEGFCVPVVESQFHRLPVIALDRCAVKETIGQDQLIFEDLDYETFAAAIHVVATDAKTRDFLTEKGYENYLKYETPRLKKNFIEIMGR
jgi:glycosyltransferase involved in cell wall biosynthesis